MCLSTACARKHGALFISSEPKVTLSEASRKNNVILSTKLGFGQLVLNQQRQVVRVILRIKLKLTKLTSHGYAIMWT